ncbi:hypothetical protein ACMYZ5_01830 [Bacteroides sp. KG68]|jgi:hypothetical protein|uniref:hypothetical protein n=1 Tax=unclassified Bacteroides TaxID=2646097 RepID=UPI003D7F5D84
MEDILKFLLIAAGIVIAIVKQFKKETQQNAGKKPVSPVPDANFPQPGQRDKNTYEEYGIPEDSGMKTEAIRQSPVRPAKQHRNKKRPSQPQTTASPYPSVNAFPPSAYSPQESDETSDFGIHSAEEARKAVIWSEIIRRKY